MTSPQQELQLTSDKGDQMRLQTYYLRDDKVLNVLSLFSRVDHTRSLYSRAVYYFTLSVSQADQSQAYKLF